MARQGFDMKEKRKSRRLVYHGRHQSAESQGKTAKGEGGKTVRKKSHSSDEMSSLGSDSSFSELSSHRQVTGFSPQTAVSQHQHYPE